MKRLAGVLVPVLLCGSLSAGECEVIRKYDFNSDGERPKEFTSGGEYPHPENKAMGNSVVLSGDLDYEGDGKCVVLEAGGPGGEPWYGGREIWLVLDRTPTSDLRISLCAYTEDVASVQPIAPVDGADDNCYNTSVPVRKDGKTPAPWMQDPVQRLDDRQWGTITWDLFRNKFNATHVAINTEMHSLNGIRFHPGGAGDNTRTFLALDNVVLYRGDDVQPPAAIEDLKVSAAEGVVTLTWSRPEDNLFAVLYRVYRSAAGDVKAEDGNLVAVTHNVAFTDTTLVNPGGYHYRVVAYDYAGNASDASNEVRVRMDDDGNAPGE
ncbi:MAG: fibronectin type III domain-containing protein [Planctomycetes bacterium]|nr:fibronectin type III domain-containing protein [Planctomycetota bacterium]